MRVSQGGEAQLHLPARRTFQIPISTGRRQINKAPCTRVSTVTKLAPRVPAKARRSDFVETKLLLWTLVAAPPIPMTSVPMRVAIRLLERKKDLICARSYEFVF